jgi:hypothetical protein
VRLFAKGARKRAARAVESLGYPDEEIVEVDTGRSVVGNTRRDFIASAVALYVYDPATRHTDRFPYSRLAQVLVDDQLTDRGRYPGAFGFEDRFTGGRFSFYEVTVSNGMLPRYVRDALDRDRAPGE